MVPGVPEVPEKVVPVQDLAQEVLEVEVDQNPVNRAGQVGPEVQARIPIEITVRVERGCFATIAQYGQYVINVHIVGGISIHADYGNTGCGVFKRGLQN